MVSKAQLWRVQRQEFPDSVRIDAHEALAWCAEAKYEQQGLRYMSLASTVVYPKGVFYYIAGTSYRGYRYGLQPEDYLALI